MTIRELALEDRAGRSQGIAPMTVPAFPRDGRFGAFIRGVPDGVLGVASQYPAWRDEVTVRSLEHLIEFEPAGWAPYVACPLLMIVAENDVCTFADIQRDVFPLIPEPSRLVSFDGNHFDAYREYFAETSEPAVAWLTEHL